MTRTHTVFCLSECISPMSHMQGVSGNESLVKREPVVTPRGVQWVPALSGNALRHRLVREPGARWLVGRLGLAGKLNLAQLNYLFHGGNLTEGGGREDTRRIADMQRLFPLSRLLGGSLPSQILSGSLLVQRGLLVCQENRQAIESALPVGWTLPEQAMRPAEAFVSDARHNQYTRGDARKSQADLLAEHDADDSNLMIFSGQAVTRGACFVHGFTLQHVSELELGALLLSLALWREAGGTVGGQGARGHGRLQTWVHLPEDTGAAALQDAYAAHCDAVRDEAVEWLTDAFTKPQKPEAKKPKGKGKKAETEASPAPVADEPTAEGLFS